MSINRLHPKVDLPALPHPLTHSVPSLLAWAMGVINLYNVYQSELNFSTTSFSSPYSFHQTAMYYTTPATKQHPPYHHQPPPPPCVLSDHLQLRWRSSLNQVAAAAGLLLIQNHDHSDDDDVEEDGLGEDESNVKNLKRQKLCRHFCVCYICSLKLLLMQSVYWDNEHLFAEECK